METVAETSQTEAGPNGPLWLRILASYFCTRQIVTILLSRWLSRSA